MRHFQDKYAQLALGLMDKIRKKVGSEDLTPTLWALADYLERVDDGKHDQHLIQLAVKKINAMGKATVDS